MIKFASRWKTRFLELTLAGVVGVVSLIFLDRGMGLFGFPATPMRSAHRPRLNETRETIEFQYLMRTNSQGLRYDDIPLKKPSGAHRVFVVGDSFTEGMGVEGNETFSSILERTFTSEGHPSNFINAGLTGTGPEAYARVFFGVGLGYQPDALLICIFGQNDVSDTPETLSPAELHPERYVPAQGIKRIVYRLYPHTYSALYLARQAKAVAPAKNSDFIGEVTERARALGINADQIARWEATLPRDLVNAVNAGRFNGAVLSHGLLRPYYVTDALDIDTPRAERKWASMVVALNEMVTAAKANNIAVAIAYLPSAAQYDSSAYDAKDLAKRVGVVFRERWLNGESEVEKRLATWSGEQRVPFFSLTPTFRQQMKLGKRFNWPLDGHWNPQGHVVAAEGIHDWLRQTNAFRFLN
jgi:lysophospholipase L1-like esterase